MWVISSIAGKNFFSYSEFEYTLVNNVLTMIYGINLDRSKKKSNGSGKSTLFDAIAFAITGDTLKKLKTLKKIINNDATDITYVDIILTNESTHEILNINRSIGRKQPQKVVITYNGEIQHQLIDLHARESDKFIQEKLCISFDDLLNYYIISKYKYKSLFLAGDVDKKEVINRFSKADIIDAVFPLIDKDEKEILDEHQQTNNQLIEVDTKISTYEEQIEELVATDSDDKKKERIKIVSDKIEITQNTIDSTNNANIEITNEINKIKNLIEESKKKLVTAEQLQKFDAEIDAKNKNLEAKRTLYKNVRNTFASEFEQLDCQEKEIKKVIQQLDSNVVIFEKEIKELESFLAGEIECPKCQHHFILADKTFDVEHAKANVVLLTAEKEKDEKCILEQNESLEKIKIDREEIENKIIIKQKEIKSEADIITKEIEKLDNSKLALTRTNNTLLSEINSYESKIKIKQQTINVNDNKVQSELKNIEQYNKDIDSIKSESNDEAINKLNEKISELTIKQENLKKQLLELENKNTKINEWRNKFKKFKSFLANTSINQIQFQANYYLEKMKADMQVFIDGYRELSNGKLKEEITIELSRDGLEGEEFGAFSGGEKSIADLSSILAMQNIINTTSETGGLDFLGIDEVLESIDDEGMNDITRCLSQLNQTVLLIAHSQPNESLDVNKLCVEKKQGVSKLINLAL